MRGPATKLDEHGPAPLGEPGRASVRPQVAASGRAVAPRWTDRELRAPLAVGSAGLAAVVYLALTDPYRPGRHLACPVLALTGFFCAGCGAQRAVHDLAHGDLPSAWGMNPLVVLGAPVAVVLWWRWLQRRRGTRAPTVQPAVGSAVRGAVAAPWVLAAVVVAFAVLRNVPALAPWLAP